MRRRRFVSWGGTTVLSLAVARPGLAQASLAAPRDLVVVRTFDVTVTNVWQAWEDPALVRRWWGPQGFTCPVAQMDFRVGGTSLVCMRSPDGTDFYSTWAYTEIVPSERFEYVFNLADEHGQKLDPAALGMPPDFPRDARHGVVFEALAGSRTRMTMTEFGYTSDQMLDLSRTGLEQCLDKMAAIFA